jgi:hypothetical protein
MQSNPICPPLSLSLSPDLNSPLPSFQSPHSNQHSYTNTPTLPPSRLIQLNLYSVNTSFLIISRTLYYLSEFNYSLLLSHVILARILHPILFVLLQSTHGILVNLTSYDLFHVLSDVPAPSSTPRPRKVCPYGWGYSKTSPTGCAICRQGRFDLFFPSTVKYAYPKQFAYSLNCTLINVLIIYYSLLFVLCNL